jgi:hypothetical protein
MWAFVCGSAYGRRDCLDVGVRVRIVRWSERLFRCGRWCADRSVVGETVLMWALVCGSSAVR